MPEEELTPTKCVVICHTEGCGLAEVVRSANLYANPALPIYRAACGQCDQAITDITPITGPVA
ncbi:hypothetical protein M2271_006501 [Streptomyces sp. LBL]|uniref:hypothetical protein n=1 Tax=Streptomyces sp. LBL TaxID=2940562 RepID=UPI0024764112|nr:hypothetical protein [Streptomyces sp. LBL]MDH6628668.1 hypothetical protein [Streptomyces sp. LBL]